MLDEDIKIARKRDQFYTQNHVAKDCLATLNNCVDLSLSLCIEPSAGTGAFLSALKEKNIDYNAYDIEPKHEDIKLQNFLLLDKQEIKDTLLSKKHLQNIVTIGNPPFGKNSSLAIKFFNHAALFSDVIAMILPATFEKSSVKKRLHQNMHLLLNQKIKDDNFLFENKLVSVPTVFQIWIKKDVLRESIKNKKTSEHFSFVKKEEANFAIQRVGAAAGKIKTEIANIAETSHYFIKANNDMLNIFNKIDYNEVKYNTAGNPSISKSELVELFEKTYELLNK